MKKSDIAFLASLRRNARETLTAISRKTKIPISTLYDKLKIHEGNVIIKHTTLIDFAKLGYSCRANILLRTTRDSRDNLCSYLKEHPQINNLFKINNGYDFMAEGIFESVKSMEDFLDDLEQRFALEEKRFHYIIDDLKRECFAMQ
ncbi:Lrp/AsnC family transcriptional regulator [Candidatus Woesearchaeota archaeon]|nr:Lrp/AsnC family transcriptional regulator [Candidatus Woesearchaeota archaeon]